MAWKISNSSEQELLERLKDYFSTKAQVKKVFLFGSYARGDVTRRSDVDLLIILDRPKPYLERLEDFRDLLLSFPEKEWDILVWTEEELQQGKGKPFMRHILKEAKVLYERK